MVKQNGIKRKGFFEPPRLHHYNEKTLNIQRFFTSIPILAPNQPRIYILNEAILSLILCAQSR